MFGGGWWWWTRCGPGQTLSLCLSVLSCALCFKSDLQRVSELQRSESSLMRRALFSCLCCPHECVLVSRLHDTSLSPSVFLMCSLVWLRSLQLHESTHHNMLSVVVAFAFADVCANAQRKDGGDAAPMRRRPRHSPEGHCRGRGHPSIDAGACTRLHVPVSGNACAPMLTSLAVWYFVPVRSSLSCGLTSPVR